MQRIQYAIGGSGIMILIKEFFKIVMMCRKPRRPFHSTDHRYPSQIEKHIDVEWLIGQQYGGLYFFPARLKDEQYSFPRACGEDQYIICIAMIFQEVPV